MSKHTVLLIGDARMAFPVAKAAAKAGHQIHAGVSIYSNYLEWSRYVSKSFRHAPLEPGTDEALPAILNWLEKHPEIDTLQPVSEAGLRFLTRHRDLFETRARLAMAKPEAIKLASDKEAMFALCEDLDVPMAAWHRVESLENLNEKITDIGYPLIIKPSVVDAPLFGRKALLINTADELEHLFPDWPEEHPSLLVQRRVKGDRHSVVFSAQSGELLKAVQIHAIRTHLSDGTGYTTYGETVAPHPAVKSATEAIVRRLNYSGTGCTQFMINPNQDDLTFMELNPRMSLARIAEAAGVPHSVLAIAVAHDEAITETGDPWDTKQNVRYVWTKGDLNRIMSDLKHGDISFGSALAGMARILADTRHRNHAVLDLLDPLPALGVYTNPIIKRFRSKQSQ
ncbi:MAG: hypothetical protein AAF296_08815 [Pseudomonadota bacterium]